MASFAVEYALSQTPLSSQEAEQDEHLAVHVLSAVPDHDRRQGQDARRRRSVHRRLPARGGRAVPDAARPHDLRQPEREQHGVVQALPRRRVRRGDAGLPRPLRLLRRVRPLLPGAGGRLRHAGVDRRPAVVRRQHRHVRHLLRRLHAVADGAAAEQVPEGDGAHRLPAGQLRPLARRRPAAASCRAQLHQHGGPHDAAGPQEPRGLRGVLPAAAADHGGRRPGRPPVLPVRHRARHVRRLLEGVQPALQVRRDRDARLRRHRVVRQPDARGLQAVQGMVAGGANRRRPAAEQAAGRPLGSTGPSAWPLRAPSNSDPTPRWTSTGSSSAGTTAG